MKIPDVRFPFASAVNRMFSTVLEVIPSDAVPNTPWPMHAHLPGIASESAKADSDSVAEVRTKARTKSLLRIKQYVCKVDISNLFPKAPRDRFTISSFSG